MNTPAYSTNSMHGTYEIDDKLLYTNQTEEDNKYDEIMNN